MPRFSHLLLCLIALSLFCEIAVAQSGSGELAGDVSDPAGASIPGANITIQPLSTEGLTLSTETTSTGSYALTSLRPGIYKLRVQAQGFVVLERSGITIKTGARERLDLTLRPGSTSDVITVTADTSLLSSESGALSTVIGRESINSLPLNGRNIIDLTTLAPGVSLPPGTLLPRINGGRPRTNEYLYDGVSSLQPEPGQVAFFPIIDAIQEFKIETNSPAAQFGRFNGGVINLTTKAGTNDFHGSAFEFFRNEALNARNLFAPATPANPSKPL